ncbi:hypothetical protein Barb7_02668 [Bacteroidales bacterium Barb7]|nr:hypothetical protein Barb7_02668 [Bacteroidales bacterium Barb7]
MLLYSSFTKACVSWASSNTISSVYSVEGSRSINSEQELRVSVQPKAAAIAICFMFFIIC